MSKIVDILIDNFGKADGVSEFEFLRTEERSYSSPVEAMVSSIEGYLPIPKNLRRLSRLSSLTNISKGSLLLSLAHMRGLRLRSDGKAFGHHNRMQLAGKASADEFSQVALALLSNSRGIVAVSSRVRKIDGSIRHFLMLDFACRNDEVGQDYAISILRQLDVHGILINSGRSFHFYSDTHFPYDEWVSKMGHALLFAPLTDGAWIAHQLIEGRAALRISKKGQYELQHVLTI